MLVGEIQVLADMLWASMMCKVEDRVGRCRALYFKYLLVLFYVPPFRYKWWLVFKWLLISERAFRNAYYYVHK